MAAHTGRIGDYILGEILNLTQPVRVLHLSVPVSTAEVQNLTETARGAKDGVAVEVQKGEKNPASCRYWAGSLW